MWTIDASCNKKYLTQWKEGGTQVSHSVPIKGLTTDYPFLTSVKDHVTLENHQTYGKKNVKVWWRAQSAEKPQVNADESESNIHFHMTHWVWWIVNIWGGIHVHICVSSSKRILNFESRTIGCSQTYYLGVDLSWYLTTIQQRKRNYIGLGKWQKWVLLLGLWSLQGQIVDWVYSTRHVFSPVESALSPIRQLVVTAKIKATTALLAISG